MISTGKNIAQKEGESLLFVVQRLIHGVEARQIIPPSGIPPYRLHFGETIFKGLTLSTKVEVDDNTMSTFVD